jgi:ABC-type nickel/cobalt efflux system permease component RcnA
MLSAEVLNWFREGQRIFNDLVFTRLQDLQQARSFAAYLSLALVGFLYGVVHAVGPGHGKVVVSSYVMANDNSLKRGLLVVVLSSLLQALTAITIVFGFYYMLAATRTQAEHAASLLETGSFVMIGGLGLWLVIQGLHSLKKAVRFGKAAAYGHAHVHSHVCGDCGHAHVPSVDQLQDHKSVVSLTVMIVSIGLRPCTGALLLLFFSCMFDLAWAGALAVFVMSVGTAVTTGALALFAVKSKDLALSFVKKSDRSMLFMHAGLRLCGGVVIMIMAGLFLSAHLSGDAPLTPAQHPLYKTLH